MMSIDEYVSHDALGLAELLRRGEVSQPELTDTALNCIARLNPELNAVVKLLEPDARRRPTEPLASERGPFHGVPFLLKNLVPDAVAGVPLTMGSRAFMGYAPRRDSTLVRRYRDAGLSLLGYTNCPEFGLAPVTTPELFGPTHNPWHADFTAGGSSGGSAAAVSSGMVPMASGSDLAGSIRIPSACCGLFGLKPSRGRVPVDPLPGEAFGFLAVHALTHTVRDSATLLDAIAGASPGSSFQAPPPARPFANEVGTDPGRLRVALCTQPCLPAVVDPECLDATQDAARLLESLGHHVEEVASVVEIAPFAANWWTASCAGAAAILEHFFAHHGKQLTRWHMEPTTAMVVQLGQQVSGAELLDAFAHLHEVSVRLARFFEKFDILLSPTTAAPPAPHEAFEPAFFDAQAVRFMARLAPPPLLRPPPSAILEGLARDPSTKLMAFTPLASVAGLPAANIPLHWNRAGLPVGTLFTSAFGDEAVLIRLAAQLEQAHPWRQRRPPIHAERLR